MGAADEHAIRFIDSVLNLKRRNATGVLEVSAGEDVARAYFSDGELIFVEHKSLGRTFGAYLLDRGILSRSQYEELAAEIRTRGAASPMMALTELAISRDMLAASTASTLMQGQVERNLVAVFGWQRFDCRFSADRALVARLPRFPCKLEALVLQGIRNRFDARSARAGLTSRKSLYPGLVMKPSEVVRVYRLQPAELAVVREIDGRRTVGQLLSHPDLDAEVAACVLLALQTTGALEWKDEPGGKARPTAPSASEKAPPVKFSRIPVRSVRVTLPNPPSAEEVAAASAFRRAISCYRKGDLVGASRELKHAIEGVDHPEYGLHLVWVEAERAGLLADPRVLGKLADAARRALQHDPTLAFGYFAVGQLHLRQGDELNAELAFQRAARLDPGDPRAQQAQDELRERRDEER